MATVNNLEPLNLPAGAVFDPGRFGRADLGIALEPSFRLERGARVFTMGSCFAVRVREALVSAGLRASDGELKEKYNAFAMLQEVRWCLEGGFSSPHVLRTDAGRWFNPHRAPARSSAERKPVFDAHLAAQAQAGRLIREADAAVLTFGLIEAWWDSLTECTTNETPAFSEIPWAAERFRLRRTTQAENKAAILALVRLLRAANPNLGIIASVSPVPLKATFAGPDVLVANTLSKATLLCALHEAIAELRAEGTAVDYFPSYELVMLAPERAEVWCAAFDDGSPDGRHVRADFVQRAILPLFLSGYVA